jgi:hypothetical protein
VTDEATQCARHYSFPLLEVSCTWKCEPNNSTDDASVVPTSFQISFLLAFYKTEFRPAYEFLLLKYPLFYSYLSYLLQNVS